MRFLNRTEAKRHQKFTVGCVKSNILINTIKNLRQLLPDRYRYGKNGNGGITKDLKKYRISI